jgi:hypothetical protein
MNAKILHLVHKIQLLDPIVSQISPVHVLTPCIFKVNSNIILQSKPRNMKLLPSRFTVCISYLSRADYMRRTSTLLD